VGLAKHAIHRLRHCQIFGNADRPPLRNLLIMTNLLSFPISKKWPPKHPDRIQLYSLPTPNGVKCLLGIADYPDLTRALATLKFVSGQSGRV
jgi:hypothetical protein